jgi:hypothetical protein
MFNTIASTHIVKSKVRHADKAALNKVKAFLAEETEKS